MSVFSKEALDTAKTVDESSDIFTRLSDTIWANPELSLLEFKSMETYCKLLDSLGFTVEKGICGVPTAFSGSFGHGRPLIGILGEFDALSGLSQKDGVFVREELTDGGCGHGCGHNLLGAGALAAAYAVKRYLEDTQREGTVIFYGCPGEEGGSGKAFMAREGLFKSLDFALSWHPDDYNGVVSGTNNSCIQKEYKFTGVASHAAQSPHLGRSGLDAVELMNIGVQFLREHMPDCARIHYSITDAGGNSPNVVQPYAQVLYMVRSIDMDDCIELAKRVDNIAKGAALMTDTVMTERFIDSCANLLPNYTLEKQLYDSFVQVGVPKYSDDENAFAKKMQQTFEIISDALPGVSACSSDEQIEFIKKHSENGSKPLNDFLPPMNSTMNFQFGSTDVGDVSRQTPTAQIRVVTFPSRQQCHSWQNVACGKTSFAKKGMLCAAKVLALCAVSLIENPDTITLAQQEFREKLTKPYVSPIPANVKPTAVGGKM